MPQEMSRVLKLGDLFKVAEWEQNLPWEPFASGVEIYRLYGDGESGPAAALLRFRAGGRVGLHEHSGFEHIIVLTGEQVDETSRSTAGTLIINPPGTSHSILSKTGCIVLAIYEKPVRFLSPADS